MDEKTKQLQKEMKDDPFNIEKAFQFYLSLNYDNPSVLPQQQLDELRAAYFSAYGILMNCQAQMGDLINRGLLMPNIYGAGIQDMNRQIRAFNEKRMQQFRDEEIANEILKYHTKKGEA